MQPPAPPPPEAPAAPAAPAPLEPTVAPAPGQAYVARSDGAIADVAVARAAPRTAQELAGLRRQRSELSRQLESAQDRRKDVARALERADNPANQAGLEQRLRVLDQRIAQLETDMAETGRLITTASPTLFAGTGDIAREVRDQVNRPGDGPPGTVVAIMAILFGVFPLVLALARRLSRGTPAPRPDPFQRESAERLARLEQAIEAIAIEVERVSEGQRFVTRVLAEARGTPAVAAGQDADDTHDALPRYAANG